jgi:HYR domain
MRVQMNIHREGVAVFRIVPLLVAALALATLLGPAAARPADSVCVHTDAVFYSTDTMLLAGRLHAAQSSCADYYLSVTPAADGSPRGGVAPVVRANGPQFHAMPEVRLRVWTTWVQQTGNSWYQAGVEVRRRMVTAGFDVAQGDTWAINEVGTPSGMDMAKEVFNDVGSAREDLRDFVRGLYTGDPGMPPAPGLVFVANPTQITADLEQYKDGLRSWYRDGPFWSAMSQYVRFWAQETYADTRNWGVPGSSLADRAAHLNDYFQHANRLAEVDPDASPAARAFLAATYMPIANAAYPWGPPELMADGIGFGFTSVTLPQMQNFIATQTYALRSSLTNARFGFAWVPNTAANPRPSATTLAALRDTLAQSIQGSQTDPAGACGPALTLCDSSLNGAAFTEAWKTFTDATPPVVVPEVDGPLGANSWYVGDVSLSWNVSDPESAVTTNGCDTTIVDTDTAGTTFTCTATSLGGATTSQLTVKRDATAPVLLLPGDLSVDATGPEGATIDYAVSAADELTPDPVVSCDQQPGSGFPVGTTTVTCTATDAAGNIGTATFAVHVRGAEEQIGRLGDGLVAAQLKHGLTTALLAKLDAAARALASGDSACPHLNALVTFVRNAEGVNHLSANLADAFVEAARRAADVSGC